MTTDNRELNWAEGIIAWCLGPTLIRVGRGAVHYSQQNKLFIGHLIQFLEK